MKTITFQNTHADYDRFLSKRLNIGLRLNDRGNLIDNIVSLNVVGDRILNLITKFIIVKPNSNNPELKTRLPIDQTIVDGFRIKLTNTTPPHMLMKTMAVFGGINVDNIRFDNSVLPLNISKPTWNIRESDSYDPNQQCPTRPNNTNQPFNYSQPFNAQPTLFEQDYETGDAMSIDDSDDIKTRMDRIEKKIKNNKNNNKKFSEINASILAREEEDKISIQMEQDRLQAIADSSSN